MISPRYIIGNWSNPLKGPLPSGKERKWLYKQELNKMVDQLDC